MLIDWLTPGRVFTGFFQIAPEKAERYFANKREEPESEKRTRIFAGYIFKMDIISADRNEGLFEARGEDFFGPSKIKGQIRANNIQFKKTYTDERKSHIRPFEQANFRGDAVIIGNAMIAGGSYHPTVRKWKIYQGIWQMYKNPDGSLACPGWMEPRDYLLKPLRVKMD